MRTLVSQRRSSGSVQFAGSVWLLAGAADRMGTWRGNFNSEIESEW